MSDPIKSAGGVPHYALVPSRMGAVLIPVEPGIGDIENHVVKVADHQAAIAALVEVVKGLLARHEDGSDERFWAEWDTAKELLKEVEG